jgi:hypothetical protein
LVLFFNEGTKVGRISSLSRDAEKKYFYNLTLIIEKHKLFGSKMFNVDETNISTV